MSLTDLTLEGMNKWATGQHDTARKMGYQPLPVVEFGEIQYILLWNDLVHPGHNTAEVFNITEFDHNSPITVLITEPHSKKFSLGNAWVEYLDEGGMAILCVHNGKITNYSTSRSAVLSYRIIEPTRDDDRKVRQMLDEELDASAFGEQIETALRFETKIQSVLPTFIRQLRRERGWNQTELGEQLGKSQQYVGFLENGDRHVTVEIQQKLAKILQRSPVADKLEKLILGGDDPREIQRELAKMVDNTGKTPRGQLWQSCDTVDCDNEPACLNCLMCEDVHCVCDK